MLTTMQVDKAKPQEKPYRLFDGLGLYIEIAPKGGKYWRFKYLFLGKEKRLALGKYPDLSLAEAREKRDQARKLLSDNIDPSVEKKDRRNAALIKADATCAWALEPFLMRRQTRCVHTETGIRANPLLSQTPLFASAVASPREPARPQAHCWVDSGALPVQFVAFASRGDLTFLPVSSINQLIASAPYGRRRHASMSGFRLSLSKNF